MNQTFLRFQPVQNMTGLPRSTIYRLISQGKFPKPIKLTARSVGFLASDIDAWIKSRIDQQEV